MGKPISADGCFGAINGTSGTITSLILTFQNTAAVQNATAPDVAGTDVFQTANFRAPANKSDPNAFYTFIFSGGGLVPSQSFVITEDGVAPGDFPTVNVSFTTTAVTPEPSSLLLVGTSFLCMGLVTLHRRYV